MKKFLMAAVATTALAIAAPAFAQTSATPQATPPATSAQPMDNAQPSAQPASPQAQTSTPTPDTAAAPTTQPAPSTTADNAPAPSASMTAENTSTATRTRHSSRRAGGASTFGSSSNVALNTQVPAPVSEVVQRGHYTAEDLNRAQLQALQTGSSTSPG